MIRVEDRGAIRILVLDNPRKRNALTPAMVTALGAAAAAVRDPGVGVRCLVIRGEGGQAFCSGFDLDALPRVLDADTPLPDEGVERALDAIEAVPCPTIAYLNGSAFGGGADLAAACDLRMGSAGIQIGMPPAKLGLVYGPRGLARFVRLIGLAHTRELFFTGAPIDGRRALEIGFINRLFEPDDLEAAVFSVAEEICKNAPLAVQGMKAILSALSPAPDAEVRAMSVRLRRAAFESADAREGHRAALERRAPDFKGR